MGRKFPLRLLMGIALVAITIACAEVSPLPTGGVAKTPVQKKHLQGPGEITSLIAKGKIAQADDAYATYRNTEDKSRGIPHMIVQLAQAHLRSGEYLLTRFYVNEYRRDFPSSPQRDAIEYVNIQSILAQYRSTKNEDLLDPFRAEIRAFRSTFPHSRYRKKITRLETQMHQMKTIRYRELAAFYDRRGKPKAAAIYRAKIRQENAERLDQQEIPAN